VAALRDFLALQGLIHSQTVGGLLGLRLFTAGCRSTASLTRQAGFRSCQHRVAALDVRTQVVRLRELLDHEPAGADHSLDTVNLASRRGDQVRVAFQHGRNLFRFDPDGSEDTIFVVTPSVLLWFPAWVAPDRWIDAIAGKPLGSVKRVGAAREKTRVRE